MQNVIFSINNNELNRTLLISLIFNEKIKNTRVNKVTTSDVELIKIKKRILLGYDNFTNPCLISLICFWSKRKYSV